MSSQPPPIETEEQETADFLATQFVFGNGEHPTVGLDVLVTKVAVDFVGLTSEAGDNCVKRNLDALREATGVDAICIALLDGERKIIERVAAATGLVTPFDPQVMKGDAVERLPVLNGKLEHLRVAEIRDTLHPRREHAVDAARLAEFNVRAALVCGLSLNGRVNGFIALFSSQPRKEGWDANLHLMLKLVGSSFATGLERLRVQRYLARLEERNALSLPAANDGMWDFDVENNTVYYSPRQPIRPSETTTITPNAPNRYGPIVLSLNACTLSTTPLRVRNVPRIVSENVATSRLRFQTRSMPRRSCTITEWM